MFILLLNNISPNRRRDPYIAVKGRSLKGSEARGCGGGGKIRKSAQM
jgi:hypothetical protein